ncbi:HAD domain-containing protein [Hymenobacter sp. ASUV-10]|uniref:HAD domain-containing protein n=2 Tax=Hymenobacter aranciens TaxID=3063996 RepID=A0ABT9B643_9BACT|nr:HAD domain-containing protein [Hymenobacter sp. ASUV-10]
MQVPVILLEFDGVLVTTPIWRPVELLADGFMKFNEKAAGNLNRIIELTGAELILTTTHRITYGIDEWCRLLATRGIRAPRISKINEAATISAMSKRAAEIEAWVTKCGVKNYVVIDDDSSINGLPDFIKNRFVQTKPMLGLDDESARKALGILRSRIN